MKRGTYKDVKSWVNEVGITREAPVQRISGNVALTRFNFFHFGILNLVRPRFQKSAVIKYFHLLFKKSQGRRAKRAAKV